MLRRDWTLLAIDAGKDSALTPVQLQKSLFLLGAQLPKTVGSEYYSFEPYNYGPFSREVYGDAEELEQDGLVSIAKRQGRSWAEYLVTQQGATVAREVRGAAPPHAVAYLESAVRWTRGLTFKQLVEAIYEAYPEQRANSVFR